MCTINEDDYNEKVDENTQAKLTLTDKTVCIKCKIPAVLVLRVRDAYCRACFLYYVTHKLRSSLGKSKIMVPNDNVLVGFSGSSSSLALLQMLTMGKKEPDPKKLTYKIMFAFIDDGALLNQSKQERIRITEELKNLVETNGFTFHLTSLGLPATTMILNRPSDIENVDDSMLLDLFKSVGSLTSKEDLFRRLKVNRLVEMAKRLECNKLFTAEDQNSLAVKLMTCVAHGRGEQMGSEVGFLDTRYDGVTIIRPMRRIESVEIEYYNNFMELSCVKRTSLAAANPNATSIQKLTSEFLSGLLGDFKDTTCTVSRTGDKLEVDLSDSDNENTCLLCRGKLSDKNDNDAAYCAVDATAFSRTVSRPVVCHVEGEDDCCGSCSCTKNGPLTDAQLLMCFCYGCMIILREMKSMDHLPDGMNDLISKRISLTSMRKEIQDFLL